MTLSPEERAYRRARRIQRETLVVEALRREGIMSTSTQVVRIPARRRGTQLLAAALIAVAGSAVGGYQLGRTTRMDPVASPAVEVQQAGDAYVRALRLLGQEDDASVSGHQAREVGVAALLAAASALAETAPTDSTMRKVIRELHVIRVAARTEGER